MTKEELEELYENCKLEHDNFDFMKYDKAINDCKGAWFYYNVQERNDTYDKSMIDYMAKNGFVVHDDPFCENMSYGVGWVVFPPKSLD